MPYGGSMMIADTELSFIFLSASRQFALTMIASVKMVLLGMVVASGDSIWIAEEAEEGFWDFESI